MIPAKTVNHLFHENTQLKYCSELTNTNISEIHSFDVSLQIRYFFRGCDKSCYYQSIANEGFRCKNRYTPLKLSASMSAVTQHFLITYPVFILTSRGYNGFCIWTLQMLYYPLKYYSVHVIVLRYWQCGSKMLTSLCSITWNGIWNRLFAKITSSWKKTRLQYLVSNMLILYYIVPYNTHVMQEMLLAFKRIN